MIALIINFATKTLLERTWREIEYRLNVLRKEKNEILIFFHFTEKKYNC